MLNSQFLDRCPEIQGGGGSGQPKEPPQGLADPPQQRGRVLAPGWWPRDSTASPCISGRMLCVHPLQCLTADSSWAVLSPGLGHLPWLPLLWAHGLAVCPQLLQTSPCRHCPALTSLLCSCLLWFFRKTRMCAPHLSDSLCWLKLAAFLKIITASGNYYN